MRLHRKYWLASAVAVIFTMSLGSCVDYNTYFEDDEWIGADYNGESLLLNGELEIDDFDR